MIIFLSTYAFSANVEVTSNIYKDYTIFNYIIHFNQNDSINKFSFVKPSNSQVSYVLDNNGDVPYSTAGDYIIIESKDIEQNTFRIRLKSQSISKEILSTDSFKTYFNFNFELEELTFELLLGDNFGEIINIYPSNYQMFPQGNIKWVTNNITGDLLYIVNFKDASVGGSSKEPVNYLLIVSIIIPIIVISIGLIILFKKYRHLEKTNKLIFDKKGFREKEDKTQDSTHENSINQDLSNQVYDMKHHIQDGEEITKEETKEEKTKNIFDEIINKHLTKNEKEVVLLIKNQEGISQYDILNHIPKLTKSNLSKIISKLHSKRILKRIKVGKVNHIYLGEKLNKSNANSENL